MAEFARPEDIRRVIKGVRTAEKNNSSEGEVLGPSPSAGQHSVDVKVTGVKITTDVPPFEDGLSERQLWPGMVLYRNVESEGLSENDPDEWFELEDGECLVQELNNADLTVNNRYKGSIEGYRNGKPVVTVQSSGTDTTSYYPPTSGSGIGCVTWYTCYLHLGHSSVYVGQVLRPGQLIGHLGPYLPTSAHLHFSLGDGNQDQNPEEGMVTAGVATNIEDWIIDLGYVVNGVHVGSLPSPLASFSAPELALIESKFSFPLDAGLPWEGFIGSLYHTGWDYYALDFLITGTDVVDAPVYAAFQGDDVKTTVVAVTHVETVGWIVKLKHEYGYCAEDGGDDESILTKVLGDGLKYDINGRIAINIGPMFKFVNGALWLDVDYFCGMLACCEADELVVDEPIYNSTTNTFTVGVSGGIPPYTYFWDFGDGPPPGTSTDASPVYDYTGNGTFEAVVVVTDYCGTVVANSVAVSQEGCAELTDDVDPSASNILVETCSYCIYNTTGNPIHKFLKWPVVAGTTYRMRMTAAAGTKIPQCIQWFVYDGADFGSRTLIDSGTPSSANAHFPYDYYITTTGFIWLEWELLCSGDGVCFNVSLEEHAP